MDGMFDQRPSKEKMKYNAYLLLSGMLSKDLPETIKLSELIDEDKLYRVLDDIRNGVFMAIYKYMTNSLIY